MRSEVFSFIFGARRNCPQEPAKVRNRPQWGSYGRTYSGCSKSFYVWQVSNTWNVVLRARRGISWHSNVFDKVSKICLCDRRNTCEQSSQDDFHFVGAALWRCPPTLFSSSRRSSFDVWYCVLVRIPFELLRHVMTKCKYHGRRGAFW